MTKDDLGEAVAGAILGIIGGLALAEILRYLASKKCPRCGSELQQGQGYCYQCGMRVS